MNKMGLAASLVLASNVASADSYDLFDHPLNFAHVVSASGSFTDVFSIVLDDNATGDILFSAATDSISAFTSLTFSGNSVNLVGNTGFFGNFSLAEVGVNVTGLVAGTYTITIAGESMYDGAGYSVDSTLEAVSPVPEPSSIALMLGGLGLVGFMAARRSKKA